jgi:hypothetical protein
LLNFQVRIEWVQQGAGTGPHSFACETETAMNLSAPSNQSHENNFVSASIKGSAIFRRGIASDFLEPSLHHGRIQPAASSLFEKNHF